MNLNHLESHDRQLASILRTIFPLAHLSLTFASTSLALRLILLFEPPPLRVTPVRIGIGRVAASSLMNVILTFNHFSIPGGVRQAPGPLALSV